MTRRGIAIVAAVLAAAGSLAAPARAETLVLVCSNPPWKNTYYVDLANKTIATDAFSPGTMTTYPAEITDKFIRYSNGRGVTEIFDRSSGVLTDVAPGYGRGSYQWGTCERSTGSKF